MKNLSLTRRWMGFLACASVLLTGAFSAYPQTNNTNVQIIIIAPTNASMFMAPTNIEIDALALDPSNKVASVAFAASLNGGGASSHSSIVS